LLHLFQQLKQFLQAFQNFPYRYPPAARYARLYHENPEPTLVLKKLTMMFTICEIQLENVCCKMNLSNILDKTSISPFTAGKLPLPTLSLILDSYWTIVKVLICRLHTKDKIIFSACPIRHTPQYIHVDNIS